MRVRAARLPFRAHPSPHNGNIRLGPFPIVFLWETTSCILRLRRIYSPAFFIPTLCVSTRLRNRRETMVTAALKRFWSGGHGEAGGEAGGATTVAVKPGLWTRLSE